MNIYVFVMGNPLKYLRRQNQNITKNMLNVRPIHILTARWPVPVALQAMCYYRVLPNVAGAAGPVSRAKVGRSAP